MEIDVDARAAGRTLATGPWAVRGTRDRAADSGSGVRPGQPAAARRPAARSVTSGWTRGSAPPRPGWRSPPTTPTTAAGHGASCCPRARRPTRPPGPGSPARSTRCTSTPCWPAAAHGQDTGRLGRKFRSEDDDPVTPDARPAGALGGAGLRRLPGRGRRGGADPGRGRSSPRCPRWARPSGPDYQQYWVDGSTRAGPALAAALARPLRPGRLADDPGLLAADAAAGRAGRADRDPDLPQPAAAVAAAADRRARAARRPQSSSPSPQSGSPSPQSGHRPAVRVTVAAVGVAVPDRRRCRVHRVRFGSPSPSGTESGGGQPTPVDRARRPATPTSYARARGCESLTARRCGRS